MQHMKETGLSLSERVVGPLVHSVARQGNYGQAEDIIKVQNFPCKIFKLIFFISSLLP